MSKKSGASASGNSDDGSSADDGSYFAWEFINDEPQRQAPLTPSGPIASAAVPLNEKKQVDAANRDGKPLQRNIAAAKAEAAKTKGPRQAANTANTRFPQARVNYIRDQLDKALDRWWAMGELPPLLLLRDALLMLEGGGSASESQRTLLLHAALAYNRGIQTALRYQVDNERVAVVLAESLVEWEPPLDAEQLPAILGNDGQLRSLLKNELERSRILQTGEPRRRAQMALAVVAQMAAPMQSAIESPAPVVANNPQGGRRIRQILFLLLVIASIAFVLWDRDQSIPSGMIAMPAAEYAMISPDGVRSAHLDAFLIDRFEVTNLEYRGCVNAGKCSWPLRTSSATRSDYFTNPAFNAYPVVQVTQGMAQNYCTWMKKRLPTVAEWQAAASVSPTTGQAFPYPWGETFDSQRANSASSKIGDTVVVGSYRPSGDSPSGGVDMAGNVAEWTSAAITTTTNSDSPLSVIVKGGSFLSEPAELNVGAQRMVVATQGTSDLGFRCAVAKLFTHS